MLRNNVSWFFAVIVLVKLCVTSVTSYEFPTFNLKSVLPDISSSIITKPIQTLYQAPLSAVNVLQRANPLNFLVPSSNPLQNINGAQNDEVKPYDRNEYIGIKYPDIQNIHYTTTFPRYNNQKKIGTSVKNYATSKTWNTPFSVAQSLKLLKHNLVESPKNVTIALDHFLQVIGQLDSKFYHVSFHKLLSISPPGRHENGISFAQSALFLYLQLMALCTISNADTVKQIKQSLGLETTCEEQIEVLKHVLSVLPKSSDFLKFRWSSRFVLGPEVKIAEKFFGYTAPALHVHLAHLNKTDSPEELTKSLNQMIDADSGWAMHDTFEEEELSTGVCAGWLTTMYLRARWRSAPTALNGSWFFYDGTAPARSVRMIRINDVMRYVHLDDWDAEVIEIRYAAPDLTLTIFMPRGRSLKNLSERITAENLRDVYEKMQSRRIAVVLPIYTLRMTLLLPGKIEMMGMSRLVDSQAGTDCQSLKISHAVQRIMFWAEAGRNAFKDDGLEWEETPQLERVVDRPYIFFVRWRNITLLNGNFVL